MKRPLVWLAGGFAAAVLLLTNFSVTNTILPVAALCVAALALLRLVPPAVRGGALLLAVGILLALAVSWWAFLLTPILLCTVVFLWWLYADNKPAMKKGYNTKIKTGGEIETKYLADGSYTPKRITYKAEKPIRKYTVYYPQELERTSCRFPLILFCNGSGWKVTRNEPELAQMASWGFVVVGTQDKATGTGDSTVTALHFMESLDRDSDSIFFQKIDFNNVGLTGFSQGGAAVYNVLTRHEEGAMVKTAVPLSSPSEKKAAEMTNYSFDVTRVCCPILLLAGSRGEFETQYVTPIEEFNEMYDRINAPKVIARRVGMDHDDMMYKAGGYVMAWFCWHLKGDEDAAKAFVGPIPEILRNPLYQDQRIQLTQ